MARTLRLLTSLLIAGGLALAATADARPATSDADAEAIAKEAYIYLYPLVTMDVTRRQVTNTDPKTNPMGGPANRFSHLRAFPSAQFRTVVRPNFDTLYSSAWIDLTDGPVIVSTADTGGRYFLLPMLDMWSDVFAVPGKRTNGTGAADFALVPPGWRGELPPAVEPIQAPTAYVWIVGRTQTNGVGDYAAVHKVQDGFRITPLAGWGKPPVPVAQRIDPSVDTRTEPLRIVNAMPARDFFAYGARLMQANPPHVTDWSTLARLRRIGLEPGKDFDPSAASPGALDKGAAAGLAAIQEHAASIARVVDGWQMNTDTMGVYGNYYLKRAIVALVGLGANQVDDAIYPLALADADGNPLRGEARYVLHFDRSQLPPADAFWSLTMYDAEGFQVANPIDRYAIGDRDALRYNEDGSLDIYIQHEDPGTDKRANWLPGPADGAIAPTLRLYAPRPAALDGTWNPPPIRKLP